MESEGQGRAREPGESREERGVGGKAEREPGAVPGGKAVARMGEAMKSEEQAGVRAERQGTPNTVAQAVSDKQPPATRVSSLNATTTLYKWLQRRFCGLEETGNR